MKYLGLFLAALVLTPGLAAPFSAATVQAVFTGTIELGYDQTGEFGAANTHLTGQSFTLSFVYETAVSAGGLPGGIDQVRGHQPDRNRAAAGP